MLKTKWKNEKNFNIGRYTEYVRNLLLWYYNYELPFKLSKEDIKYCMKHFGTNKIRIIKYFMEENIGSSERKQSKKSKNKNKK